MDTATLTWEEETKVRAEEDRGKVPAEVVMEAEKPETKLEPLIVKVVATLEVTEVGEMEEMVGAGGGVVEVPVLSPYCTIGLPSMIAPLSGFEALKPSVIFGIKAPEFFGEVPIAKAGV